MRRSIRASTLAIAALLAAALAACSGSSGGSDPTSEPTPTRTPSVTRTPMSVTPAPTRTGPLTTGPGVKPGEQPPVMPAAARQRTASGARQTGTYYFKALDWSLATNDPYLVSQISSPSCAACSRVVAGLTSIRSLHEVQMGGDITILESKLVRGAFKIKSDYAIQVRFSEARTELRGADGSRKSSSPAQSGDVLVFVTWQNGMWRVIEVGAPDQ